VKIAISLGYCKSKYPLERQRGHTLFENGTGNSGKRRSVSSLTVFEGSLGSEGLWKKLIENIKNDLNNCKTLSERVSFRERADFFLTTTDLGQVNGSRNIIKRDPFWIPIRVTRLLGKIADRDQSDRSASARQGATRLRIYFPERPAERANDERADGVVGVVSWCAWAVARERRAASIVSYVVTRVSCLDVVAPGFEEPSRRADRRFRRSEIRSSTSLIGPNLKFSDRWKNSKRRSANSKLWVAVINRNVVKRDASFWPVSSRRSNESGGGCVRQCERNPSRISDRESLSLSLSRFSECQSRSLSAASGLRTRAAAAAEQDETEEEGRDGIGRLGQVVWAA